jgi:RNA polymerase sigma-70 factor (ECF subfamily)
MEQDELVRLFKRWRKPIRQWLTKRSTIPTVDLDDIAQEVFLRLMRYNSDEVIANPQGYLFRIACNVANEFQERACRRKPHNDEWLEMLIDDDEHQPENEAERAIETKCVCAAVDALPTRMGVILLMHINDGKTYKQIAAELHISYRVVLRDLSRAYAQLRVRFS